MYIRFVVGTANEPAHRQTGLIHELNALLIADQLEPYESDLTTERFEWLNKHLPVPPFCRKRWPPQAISWFKDTASEMIVLFRDFAAILEQHSKPVRMLKSECPGAILYDDHWQIVARSRRW